FDDARAWIEGLVFSDVGKLAVAELEVCLKLLQSREGVGALANIGTRRAMGVVPHGGNSGPKLIGGPAHGHALKSRHIETQFKKINDFPRHKRGTAEAPAGHKNGEKSEGGPRQAGRT